MKRSQGNRWGEIGLGVAAVTALTTMVAMAVTGVAGPGSVVPRAAADELPAFDSCPQLASWYRDLALQQVTPWGFGGPAVMYAEGNAGGAAGGAATASSADARAASGPVPQDAAAPVTNGATGTNNQEQGVDESDLVKAAGNRVVGVRGSQIYVTTVTVDGFAALRTVDLPLAAATDLLVDGDTALVLGAARQQTSDGAAARLVPWQGQRSALAVVDLATAAVRGSEDVDGAVLSARLVGDTARVVVSSSGTGPHLVAPASPGSEQTALEANKAAIRAATAADWLPSRQLRDASGAVVSQGPLLQCNDVRHPVQAAGLGTLSVLTIGMTAEKPLESGTSVGVSAGGDLVYASTDRLYVATSRWGSWRAPSSNDEVTTQIHAFDITAPTETTYVGSGTVPGFLYDRWAMDEQNHVLRVATTSRPGAAELPMAGAATVEGRPDAAVASQDPSQSSVVTLAEKDGRLVELGRLDGLGPTEQVRAVRWLGNLAAVVTFRQTDPLYLVNLSDPASPTTAGELHLTGYSAYLHPVGDGLLLGIGHDADAQGHVGQAMVQLFDIGDPQHPTDAAKLLLGQGNLLAEQDAHAFTYLPDGTAVLPFESWNVDAKTGAVRAGALALRVDAAAKTLTLVGSFATAPEDQTQRVVPVGDHLVAVGGQRLTLLDHQLHESGSVALPAWAGQPGPSMPGGAPAAGAGVSAPSAGR